MLVAQYLILHLVKLAFCSLSGLATCHVASGNPQSCQRVLDSFARYVQLTLVAYAGGALFRATPGEVCAARQLFHAIVPPEVEAAAMMILSRRSPKSRDQSHWCRDPELVARRWSPGGNLGQLMRR